MSYKVNYNIESKILIRTFTGKVSASEIFASGEYLWSNLIPKINKSIESDHSKATLQVDIADLANFNRFFTAISNLFYKCKFTQLINSQKIAYTILLEKIYLYFSTNSISIIAAARNELYLKHLNSF